MSESNSVDNNLQNINGESRYIFLQKEEIKKKSYNDEYNYTKFDNLINKKSVLFNFVGESHLSDHVIKLDFYNKKYSTLTREEIIEYRDKILKNNGLEEIEKCSLCKMSHENKTCSCTHKNEESVDRDTKILGLFQEYIIDLKIFLSKSELKENEVILFDKIILWMDNLFKKMPSGYKESIFTRLSNEFFDLDYSYIVVIEFLKKYFNKEIL
ncbi:uncharacterized protein VNE69_04009 [Vairimorpha necatrix]|uniref:Plasmodium RESA N-terminal domain-containing protein n=1 Tax=Vairimorpha necatrix TaxID=6039 RepID=A0AAX4JB32_9MICR